MFTKSKKKPERFWVRFRRHWFRTSRILMGGLMVWIPLIVTIWVTWFFVNKLIFGVENEIRTLFTWLNAWGARHPRFYFLTSLHYFFGIGVFLVFSLFYLTGLFTRMIIGRKLISLGERFLYLIPFVNRVYKAVKQIRDVFVDRNGMVFQGVCIVEYPRPGIHAIGFIVNKEQGIVQQKLEKELFAVFVPTTPNPTSGYLVYLAPEEITPLNISVEDAMKLIISSGAYLPEPLSEETASETEA